MSSKKKDKPTVTSTAKDPTPPDRQTSPSLDEAFSDSSPNVISQEASEVSDQTQEREETIIGDEVVLIEDFIEEGAAVEWKDPGSEEPITAREGSFERTVSFLKKRGVNLHDNHDGTYSAHAGFQARKGSAQQILTFCFSHVPHPLNRLVWTEEEMQKAIEAEPAQPAQTANKRK